MRNEAKAPVQSNWVKYRLYTIYILSIYKFTLSFISLTSSEGWIKLTIQCGWIWWEKSCIYIFSWIRLFVLCFVSWPPRTGHISSEMTTKHNNGCHRKGRFCLFYYIQIHISKICKFWTKIQGYDLTQYLLRT